jgi:hypothetical protein
MAPPLCGEAEQSTRRADETYDNAHAESLFLRFKAELLEGCAFTDVEVAWMETFTYIESYYNSRQTRGKRPRPTEKEPQHCPTCKRPHALCLDILGLPAYTTPRLSKCDQ